MALDWIRPGCVYLVDEWKESRKQRNEEMRTRAVRELHPSWCDCSSPYLSVANDMARYVTGGIVFAMDGLVGAFFFMIGELG